MFHWVKHYIIMAEGSYENVLYYGRSIYRDTLEVTVVASYSLSEEVPMDPWLMVGVYFLHYSTLCNLYIHSNKWPVLELLTTLHCLFQ